MNPACAQAILDKLDSDASDEFVADCFEDAREEELADVLRHLRRKGSGAYLTGDTQRQMLLAELIGELEQREHRRG